MSEYMCGDCGVTLEERKNPKGSICPSCAWRVSGAGEMQKTTVEQRKRIGELEAVLESESDFHVLRVDDLKGRLRMVSETVLRRDKRIAELEKERDDARADNKDAWENVRYFKKENAELEAVLKRARECVEQAILDDIDSILGSEVLFNRLSKNQDDLPQPEDIRGLYVDGDTDSGTETKENDDVQTHT